MHRCFLSGVIMFMHQSGGNFQPQHPKSLFSLWSSKLVSALPHTNTRLHAAVYCTCRSGRGQVNFLSLAYFFPISIKNYNMMENSHIFPSPSLSPCNSALIISSHVVCLSACSVCSYNTHTGLIRSENERCSLC